MPDQGRKLVTIIVNTREHQVEKDEITFDEVVALGLNRCRRGRMS